MKTSTTIHALVAQITQRDAQIQLLKTDLGDAQREGDIAKTKAEFYRDKYDDLMVRFITMQAENTMMKAELGRGR